jgi:hypothetical protein
MVLIQSRSRVGSLISSLHGCCGYALYYPVFVADQEIVATVMSLHPSLMLKGMHWVRLAIAPNSGEMVSGAGTYQGVKRQVVSEFTLASGGLPNY